MKNIDILFEDVVFSDIDYIFDKVLLTKEELSSYSSSLENVNFGFETTRWKALYYLTLSRLFPLEIAIEMESVHVKFWKMFNILKQFTLYCLCWDLVKTDDSFQKMLIEYTIFKVKKSSPKKMSPP